MTATVAVAAQEIGTPTPAGTATGAGTATPPPPPLETALTGEATPASGATELAPAQLPAATTRPEVQAAAGGAYSIVRSDVYPYTVLPNESWTVVSVRTGVPIDALQAANPQAIRPLEWLLTREVLDIPVLPQPDWPRPFVARYTVLPGDSWSRIGTDWQVSPTLLWAVNPHLWRWWQVLIAGDEMLIPPAPVWPPAP